MLINLSQISFLIFRWGGRGVIIATLLGMFDYNYSPIDFFELIGTGMTYGFLVGLLVFPLAIIFARLGLIYNTENSDDENKKLRRITWISIISLIILGVGGSAGLADSFSIGF